MTWLGESAPSDPAGSCTSPRNLPAQPQDGISAVRPRSLPSPGAVGQDSHPRVGPPSPDTLAQGSVN